MKNQTDSRKIDWDNIEREVVEKINYLRMSWDASQKVAPKVLHEKLVDDLYVPAVKLLAEFCACVEVGEADEDE